MTFSLISLNERRFLSPRVREQVSKISLKFNPYLNASFASLGPFESYILESIIKVLLLPNFEANFSAEFLPASSASIHR
jgi:hypothetical protein